MTRFFSRSLLLLIAAACLIPGRLPAAEEFSSARVAVYFSPRGGCTDAVVRELDSARREIWVQAYSFTSAPIAQALVKAHRRGVKVTAVLDKSNQKANYSAATFLINAGIPTFIDSEHAIAHNKVIVIDGATVITGSFNFSRAAEERNAENLLVLKQSPATVRAYLDQIAAHRAHSEPYQRVTKQQSTKKTSSKRR